MAVVRLPDGLLLYSPLAPTEELRTELASLGPVAWLVSPNKIHNQTLAACRAAWPDAELVAPPGLRERRPDLEFDRVLGVGPPPPGWAGELDVALTGGNVFFSEALLLHRSSRTLLTGDLVENIGPGTASAMARAAARIFGVRPRPMPSPEFRYYTHDAAAAADALAPVLGWRFERIFLCHGDLIEAEAPAVFRSVSEELLTVARGRGAPARAFFRTMARWQ
jgi:hypothetical protein